MPDIKTIRIDKFLWSVRIYKTRSVASEACRRGRVFINGVQVKPSKPVCAGEMVIVRKPPVVFTFRVIQPIEKRVGAKLIHEYIEDLTPEDEKAKLTMNISASGSYRESGTGRPTKKERRDIDRLMEDFNEW